MSSRQQCVHCSPPSVTSLITRQNGSTTEWVDGQACVCQFELQPTTITASLHHHKSCQMRPLIYILSTPLTPPTKNTERQTALQQQEGKTSKDRANRHRDTISSRGSAGDSANPTPRPMLPASPIARSLPPLTTVKCPESEVLFCSAQQIIKKGGLQVECCGDSNRGSQNG